MITNFLLYFRCPKTIENFCVHSKNSYYNGHVFHRVIKGFMIQTGDPLGWFRDFLCHCGNQCVPVDIRSYLSVYTCTKEHFDELFT